MRYTNRWKYIKKDTNRFELKIRLGVLHLLDLYYDHSDKKWAVTIFNFKFQK